MYVVLLWSTSQYFKYLGYNVSSTENNGMQYKPVSYTHLDVYKRQRLLWSD